LKSLHGTAFTEGPLQHKSGITSNNKGSYEFSLFLFPADVLWVAGPEETKNLSGEMPSPDSDPFTDAEFAKISLGCQDNYS